MGSWLFGSRPTTVNTPPVPASQLRIQSSIQGRPRSIVWGTNRVAANLIWYGAFQAVPIQQEVGGGGKGGGGDSQVVTTGFNYYASVAFGLCEGMIDDVLSCWSGKAIGTAAGFGFTIFDGSYLQDPWGYLTTSFPGQNLNYRGLAYTAQASFALGGDPSLPQMSWEVKSIVTGYGPSELDANPADCLLDITSNLHYGLTFPWFRFDQDLTDYFTYTIATGMVISWALTEQQPAQTIFSDLFNATNSTARWSGGTMSVIPWGTSTITANGVTFTPDLTPVYDLDEDDFLPNQGTIGTVSSDEPVICVRKRKSDQMNAVIYEFLDRNNNYDPSAPTTARDEASITEYGYRPTATIQLHMFSLVDAAQQSAVLQLNKQQIPCSYSFTLPPKFILLDVEDIVTLTRTEMGLEAYPVRISEIQENDDKSLTFSAEDLLGTASAPLYADQGSSGNVTNYAVDPGAIADVVIFQPPDDLANPSATQIAIWGAATGLDLVNYGGSVIYFSSDDITFSQVGIVAPCIMGFLTAFLPDNVDPDNINTLSVDLTESGGTLEDNTAANVLNGIPPCYVGGEIIAYTNADLTAANNYNLTLLKRGAFVSIIDEHPIDTSFVFLNSAIFKIFVPSSMSGQTIYIKLQPFNIYNRGVADLSTLPTYTYVVGSQAPLQARTIPVQQGGGAQQLGIPQGQGAGGGDQNQSIPIAVI